MCVPANPTAAWGAHRPALELGNRVDRFAFLIHDRDTKFISQCRVPGEGTRITKTPVRAQMEQRLRPATCCGG
jgi:hypothetical protein